MAPQTTYASLAAIALLVPLSSAHMMIRSPGVWGGNDVSLENPLTAEDSDWFCHGRKKSDASRGRTTFTAGETTTIPTICGEAVDDYKNANNICTDPSSWHGGGGCALSILYKNNASPSDADDFVTFSVAADCPNKANPVPFKVPANLPNIEDAVCAWTWIPNPRNAASEMYMNCFSCAVVGGPSGQVTGGIKMKDHLWAVPGAPSGDSAKRQIKNKLSDGAQQVEVNGKVPRNTKEPRKTKTSAPKPTETASPDDEPAPTSAPEETTNGPEESTDVPDEPTEVPDETTACQPEGPTYAPEEPTTTDAPSETTTPCEPTEPTAEPTSPPEEPTTYEPDEPTSAPEETASPEPTEAPSYPDKKAGMRRRAKKIVL
ncbi:hypothetical protein HDU86_005899 [Geranomyces michiganensis]|nr:hypothetical protein HDU86_005899 [Geranomyces michiganensis]